MEISPYLSAIQSLRGENPSEKYQELHAMAKRLIEPSEERGIAAAVASSILPPALHPLLRILIGHMLKSREEVIEALKSEDLTVRNQAFRAKWFFDGSDESLNVDFFLNEVMPFVSMHAQKKIIKALSSNLKGKPEIGDLFFKKFLNTYGFEKTEALLMVSKDDTIHEMIIKHEMRLSKKQIRYIFKVYPKLIISYLRGEFLDFPSNHLLPSHNYKDFLPNLVRDYADDFIDLYEDVNYVNISCKLKNYLLKHHVDKLIAKPNVLRLLFSLEIIFNKLTTKQFEDFFGNILSINYGVEMKLSYLQYYPKNKQLALLKEKYRLKFKKELLNDINYIKSKELLKLVPINEKQKIGRKLVDSTAKFSYEYFDWCCYLPPEEAFPIFQNKIDNNNKNRLQFFKYMILCSIANESKEYMLKFLNFYNTCHKNEHASDLLGFIGTNISKDFLDKSHWAILREIMMRSYLKKELITFEIYNFLEKALYHLLVQCENELSGDTKQFLDEVVDISLEYCVDRGCRDIIYIYETPEITRQCFDIFLGALPLKYSDDHEIWKEANKKINYVNSIIRTINCINKKYSKSSTLNNSHNISLLDFPWLKNAIKSVLLLKEEEYSQDIKGIKNLLKAMEPQFYTSMCKGEDLLTEADELLSASATENIKSGAVLKLLRKNPKKIHNDWMEYLIACQKEITYCHSATLTVNRFIRAIKWHQMIPLNFVTYCLSDLKNPANIIILGLLLEGESFSKILTELILEIPEFNGSENNNDYEMMTSILIAIGLTSPPVTCQLLETFCRNDLVQFAIRAVVKISLRIAIPKAREFAKQLIKEPIPLQRCGFFMYLQISNANEQREFLLNALKVMKYRTMQELIIKKLRSVFIKYPSEATWESMKEGIAQLTVKNLQLLQNFFEHGCREFCRHSFGGRFYVELFLKIEKLAEAGDINETSKISYLCSIVWVANSISYLKGLPDKECQDIIRRYLLNKNYLRKSNNLLEDSILSFVMNKYICETQEKFESRWNFISEILSIAVKEWGLKDSDNPRWYPANFEIRLFFESLFQGIQCRLGKWPERFKHIKCILNTFNAILSPYRETSCYLKLYFCDLYAESVSFQDYGLRCGQRLPKLVKDFSSDLILEEADDWLYFVLYVYRVCHNILNTKLVEIMEGLLEANNYYASIVCIQLLKRVQQDIINEKFINIIDRLHETDNIIVKCKLNNLVSEYYPKRIINPYGPFVL